MTFPPPGFVDRNPDVSPDGREIVFQRSGPIMDDIFVVDSDGTDLRRLTNTDAPDGACLPDSGECNTSPAWSADGKRIVFSRSFRPVVDDLVEGVAIFVMRADGSHVHQLTQCHPPATGRTGEDTEPQLSPDGRSLLFQRVNVRTARPRDGVALWVRDPRTGRERRITPYRLRAGDTPDWSPDGATVLFHEDWDRPDGNTDLWTVRSDGTGLRQLTFADDGLTRYLGSSFLAGRPVDRRREATEHRRTGAQHGRRRQNAVGRDRGAAGDPHRALRQPPGLGAPPPGLTEAPRQPRSGEPRPSQRGSSSGRCSPSSR
ncbi:TolB family protein [Nocardioides taihuensis]|uniref:TolB family protein n=1 Tax=Nocardioides taihuensis TaxID=1835606 RepID=A0ABW0BFA2_9ACTN